MQRSGIGVLVVSTILLLCTVALLAAEHPLRPQKGAPGEFVCGTYRGMEKENARIFQEYMARTRIISPLETNDYAFDDVWVMEDDGSVLIGGINPFDMDFKTIRFTPNAAGGFDVAEVPFNFDTVLGNNLNLGDDTNQLVSLNFTFNYFGTPWNNVYVNANGIIAFGAIVNPSGFYDPNDFFTDLPKIAPYFMDLNPAVSGDVYYKAEATKSTITWNQVTEFGQFNSNTIQLVLRDDGSFDITFNGIDAVFASTGSPIVVGNHPGGPAPVLEIINYSAQLPYSGSAGAGIYESFTNSNSFSVNDVGMARKFYQSLPDSFDQIVYFTNFDTDMGSAFAYHLGISNHVQGIGRGIFDDTQRFGSAGRLQSVINMNWLDVWPDDPAQRFFSDGNNFLTIMGQEAGHRWGAFVFFRDSLGINSDLLLGRSLAHWSYYGDLDHSCLEGGNWVHVSGDMFVCPTQIDFFSDIDEYLMGLRLPEEVTPTFYVSSPSNNTIQARSQGTPRQGATANGTQVDVTIQQIIAAEGPRVPAEPAAQKNFRDAFVLIIRNGTTPSQAELNKIAAFRRAWEDYFERSVSGRATMNTSLFTAWPVAVATGHVIDATTGLSLNDIEVHSLERQFRQFVPQGGRYVFRYMQSDSAVTEESVTLVARSFGFLEDTLVTSIPYGSQLVHDFVLDSLGRGTLAGTVTGSGGTPVAGARIILKVTSDLTDDFTLETVTDGNGHYEFANIFMSYLNQIVYERLTIIPDLPYPITRIDGPFTVLPGQVNTLDVQLQPADLLLVNDDPNGDFSTLFTQAFEDLNVTFVEWKTTERGSAVPVGVMSQFRQPMIVWYTGEAATNVLNPQEQDSLSLFVSNGGKLFLTGKNIAEDLAAQGSAFLQNVLQVDYVGSAIPVPVIRPVASNPMSGNLSPFPAGQLSRDILSPVSGGLANPAFNYNNNTVAGVTVEDPGNGSMIAFTGFGFEAISAASSRRDVMNAVLSWMDVITGVSPLPTAEIPRTFELRQNYPNPFNPTTTIEFGLPYAAKVQVIIYNMLGQRLRTLVAEPKPAGRYTVIWNGRDDSGRPVASGVYIYRLQAEPTESGSRQTVSLARKLLLLK